VIEKYCITVIKSTVIRLEVFVARIGIASAYKTLVYIVNVRDQLELLSQMREYYNLS
jgi:hypothetical protein